MEYPTSLNALLESSQLKFRWLNIGRGIRSINKALFDSIEACQTAYPWPLAYHAWIALMVWNPGRERQHTLWFFKLPLDEQGLIIPQARDTLIRELLTMLGITALEQPTQHQTSAYTFDPDDEQKAAMHAKFSKTLAEPPSMWYQPVKDYLSNRNTSVNWSALGLQGFADIVERVSDEKTCALIANAIDWIDAPVFEALCRFLQNKKIPAHPATAITERLHCALAAAPEALHPKTFFCSGVRALSQADTSDNVIHCIRAILSSPVGRHPEVLQDIGRYCWPVLKREPLMKLYLDNLAVIPDGQPMFNRLVSDLMFVPDMRPLVLAQFRNPERSEPLGVAIGGLMSKVRH